MDGQNSDIHIEDNSVIDPMGQSIMNKSLYRITQMQMQAHNKLMQHEFSKFRLVPNELQQLKANQKKHKMKNRFSKSALRQKKYSNQIDSNNLIHNGI